MKLLNYYYHFIRVLDGLHDPSKDEYLSALKTVTFPISMVLGTSVFTVLQLTGVRELIMDNWFYDYGRVHSKNFIAPTVFFAIASYFVTRVCLKKYFYRKEFQAVLDNYFGKEEPTQKVHRILPDALTLFLILFSIFLVVGFLPGIIFCLLVIACLEAWVRKRFG